jgi:hypothetical protein
MGSGALLLMLGSLLGITQIVSYATAPLEDAGWVAMIATCASVVLAIAVAAFPRLYVTPAVAVILGVLLCASAVVFPLVNLPLLSRPVGLFSMASFGLAGLASLAVAVTLGRFDRRRSPAATLSEWWRYAGLALAIVGAVGVGLFLMLIANPGSILVFAAAISWSVALAVRLAAALRRARSASSTR